MKTLLILFFGTPGSIHGDFIGRVGVIQAVLEPTLGYAKPGSPANLVARWKPGAPHHDSEMWVHSNEARTRETLL